MFDAALTRVLQRPVQALARRLAAAGVGADALTFVALAFGLGAAVAIAAGAPLAALALLLAGRIGDGLDGAVARLTAPTDRGAFLDIVLDFVFYASVPLAFAVADPAANALAAAALLASFVVNGVAFIAYALVAERRGVAADPVARGGSKGFAWLGGLAEGFETIVAFAAMCVWPQHFAAIAWTFAALCATSFVWRVHAAWTRFAR